MLDITKKIEEEKLIAILRLVPDDRLIETAEAIYRGGIRLLEVTVNQKSKTPEKDNAFQIELLCKHFGDRMVIGAGTVITVSQASSAINAGAKFLLAPNADEEVIKFATSKKIEMIPGALTPTEIANSIKWGAKIVKLFPAGDLGLNYIKSVKAPISNANIIAVGGVDENNVCDFIKAGAMGCGLGSNLANLKNINEGKYELITIKAKEYVDAIRGAK